MQLTDNVTYRFFDLIFICATALIALGVSILTPPGGIANIVFGLFLILVAPGYALTAALFGAKLFRLSEHTLLVLSCSIATAILGGLLLNFTPWGLQRQSWTVLVTSVVVVATAVAAVRRAASADGPIITVPRVARRDAVLLGSSMILIAATLFWVRWDTITQSQTSFTQLWAIPVQPDDQSNVNIGVRNMELRPMRYRVQLRVDSKTTQEWSTSELASGAMWETHAIIPQLNVAANEAEILLFRQDDPQTVYRRVLLRSKQ